LKVDFKQLEYEKLPVFREKLILRATVAEATVLDVVFVFIASAYSAAWAVVRCDCPEIDRSCFFILHS